ncbi:MAG: asparagine synthase-related protein [Nitrososphaerota archaeon]
MAIVSAIVARDEIRLHSLLDRVLRLSYRWPVGEVYVDGVRVSARGLPDVSGRACLVAHHAGVGVVEELEDGLRVHLKPSRLLGLEELDNSPFQSLIELRRGMIMLRTGQVGSPPLNYYASDQLIAASCPSYLLGLRDAGEKITPPNTEMMLGLEGVRFKERPTRASFELASPPRLSDALETLLEELFAAVKRSVARRCALLFSGGIDSSLLAWICMALGLEPLAISVGLEGSHDLMFSSRAAKLLGVDHLSVALTEQEVAQKCSYLLKNIPLSSMMDKALSVMIYEGSRHAALNGRRQLVSGQGADELFGGYMKYLRLVESGSSSAAEAEMRRDLEMLWLTSIPRDYASAALAGSLLTMPYLDERIIYNVYNLPLEFKISRGVRKVLLRAAAKHAGVPEELVAKEKKAAQYGTGIERVLRRIQNYGG